MTPTAGTSVAGPPVSEPDLPALLDAAEAAHPSAGVEAFARELSARVGATAVSLLVVDINGQALVRVSRVAHRIPHRLDQSRPERVDLVGTAAGAAIREQRLVLVPQPDGVRVLAPVSERGETVGVLDLLLPLAPTEQVLSYVRAAAHALAYVVVADRRHTDAYELAQRGGTLSLEAEIQRRLLPPSFSCQGPQFALAGWQVSADSTGGDTFDYVVGARELALSITDAMGHGVAAALLATLAVGSVRNSRRASLDLLQQAHLANAALIQHAYPDQFVTALLVQVSLATGAAQLVNAGHVVPLLVRGGHVREVALTPGLVLGVDPALSLEVQHLQLEPGDRLVMLTDGMFEREAADAEVADVLAQLGGQHPREVAQILTRAVLDVAGRAVRDDATVLVLDWYQPAPDVQDEP